MAEASSVPYVQLDWSLWCTRHLEPYRARWPIGAPDAMMALFRAASAMPAVIDAAGGDTRELTAALQRFRPLCCFVSKTTLDEIYAATAPDWEPPGG